jgi:tetratricopeptide (TPR) repeat protein
MKPWMRPIVLAMLLAGAAIPAASAADAAIADRVFSGANQSYQKGDFGAAERGYHDLLRAGVDSGSVYYNLGNACFKQKRLGEAIYYWQKAKRRMPADRDVLENLELANLMIVDRIELPTAAFPVRLASRLVNLLTVAQESWLVLVLFSAANVLFGAYLLAGNWRVAFRSLVGAALSASLLLLFGSSLAWKLYCESRMREGIVVEARADVRSGPGNDNVTVFTVHEGIQVQIRGAAGDWYQVLLPNGWSGWVPARSVRIL